ncbi:hypothetical protein DKX38_019437 [Salix brachista]|uniref:Protein kinase domain-containing protein n=1 Tax=Salix brachista TaxID=2182728 RepID=A0A5N5KGG5_9ROSI|nr:hypothetical protein DKX38_019437 [Salix brachista]
MAAVGGHNKAAHSSVLPWYGCVPLHSLSFGEGSKEYCFLSERNLQSKVSTKPKKHSPVISSSASSFDLRASDMERERQDGSSPRGVIEACLKGLESNSDSTKNSTAESEVPRSKAHLNWSRFFKSWKRFSLKNLPSFIPPPVPKEPKCKSRSTRENTVLRNLYNFKSNLQHFTFAELKMATNNFNHENLIGKGGFAEVYKGCLPDGKLVAVKQLTKGTLDDKTAGFLNELGIIAHVDHPNTAKLLGCGIDGGMHLVFELSPLGSLGSALHGSQVKLDWSKRYKIALGAADGLLYLHENCRRRIIHRDIKADNILLTENFEPQVSLKLYLRTSKLHLLVFRMNHYIKLKLNIIKLVRTCENGCIPLDLGGGLGTVLCSRKEKFEFVNNGSGSIDVFGLESMNIFYEHDSVLFSSSLLNLMQKNSIVSICDFGLAKWLPTQWTHHNVSKFEGTFGYFAPEYYMHGIVDEKTDIYAFGVLLLELITGRRPVNHLQQSLVIWAKPLLDNNNTKELADPSLGGNYDLEEMDRVVLTASLCIEQSPVLRPRMSQASVNCISLVLTLFHVVLYSHMNRNHRVTIPFVETVLKWLHIRIVVILLRGDEYVADCAKKGKGRALLRTYSEEIFDAQDYNSTRYLNDIKRYKELALGS